MMSVPQMSKKSQSHLPKSQHFKTNPGEISVLHMHMTS